MSRKQRMTWAVAMAASVLVVSATAWAKPKQDPAAQDKGSSEQKMNEHGQKAEGQKGKPHKNVSGKDLLGAKIHQNGNQKIQAHGKFTAFANVENGKITGVNVKHTEKGDVAVTKYKTNKKMASAPYGDAKVMLAQYGSDTGEYIGYGYIDDYGEEVIYWFPVDMIADGDAGAVEYVEYY